MVLKVNCKKEKNLYSWHTKWPAFFYAKVFHNVGLTFLKDVIFLSLLIQEDTSELKTELVRKDELIRWDF